MKSFTKWMLAAAAMTAAAVSASAQDLEANIPFSFRAGMGDGNAGVYRIHITDQQNVVYLRNEETHRSSAVMAVAREDANAEMRAAGEPKLMFRCGTAGCALVGVWAGTEQPALRFNAPKSTGETRLAFIPLRMVK